MVYPACGDVPGPSPRLGAQPRPLALTKPRTWRLEKLGEDGGFLGIFGVEIPAFFIGLLCFEGKCARNTLGFC